MTKRLYYLLAVLTLTVSPAYGGLSDGVDTLLYNKGNYRTPLSVQRLIDTIYEHKEEDPLRSVKQINYALNRASDLKSRELQAKALNVKGGIYEDLGDFQTALKLHYEALRMFEQTKNAYSVAMVTNNIGRV